MEEEVQEDCNRVFTKLAMILVRDQMLVYLDGVPSRVDV